MEGESNQPPFGAVGGEGRHWASGALGPPEESHRASHQDSSSNMGTTAPVMDQFITHTTTPQSQHFWNEIHFTNGSKLHDM